jgi:hypothetical protein
VIENEHSINVIPGAPLPLLRKCQERYATRWNLSADHLTEGGDYTWMAGFIRGYDRVVEVGAGTGQSTGILLDHGHSVISVDENPSCLHMAASYLAARGQSATVGSERAHRALVRDAPEHVREAHAVLYTPVAGAVDPACGSALLLEGNILIDPEMISWLTQLPPRDAIVCWLIGIHEAVHFHSQLGYRGTDPRMYRIRVHNEIYKLANKILRPGGIVHIVDRAEDDTKEYRDGSLKSHREVATVGAALRVESLELRPYQLSDAEGHQPIQDREGRLASRRAIFLSSLVARKVGH